MFEKFRNDREADEAFEKAKFDTINQIQTKLIEMSHEPGTDLVDHAGMWINRYGGKEGVFRRAFNEIFAEYEDLIDVWNPDIPVFSSSELKEGQSRIAENQDREKILYMIQLKMDEMAQREKAEDQREAA